MARESNQSVKIYCWSRRGAAIFLGGTLAALATFLQFRLFELLAGMLGMFIAVLTYRFSKGYRSQVIGVAVVIGSCLVAGVWAGLVRYTGCQIIQRVWNEYYVSSCGINTIEVTVFGVITFAVIGALIIALPLGKLIIPVFSDPNKFAQKQETDGTD